MKYNSAFIFPLGEVEIKGNEENSDNEDEAALPNIKKQKIFKMKWKKLDLENDIQVTKGFETRHETIVENLKGKNPVQIFENIFDEEVQQHVLHQSNIYALQKTTMNSN